MDAVLQDHSQCALHNSRTNCSGLGHHGLSSCLGCQHPLLEELVVRLTVLLNQLAADSSGRKHKTAQVLDSWMELMATTIPQNKREFREVTESIKLYCHDESKKCFG